jgi:type I restriction enzyme, R subunit
VSDGLQARIGLSDCEPGVVQGLAHHRRAGDAPKTALESGSPGARVFDPRRFLDLLQHFIVFEENSDTGALHKIIAGYHQFHVRLFQRSAEGS